MLENKVCLMVCGSRKVGGYDKVRMPSDPSDPYCKYFDKKQVAKFKRSMDAVAQSVVRTEQKTNPNFSKYDILIVEGGALGPDDMSAIWARSNQIDYIEIPAKWDIYGNGAGFRRNADMVNMSKYVFAAYDGVSNGTKHSMDLAKKQKKKIRTIIF